MRNTIHTEGKMTEGVLIRKIRVLVDHLIDNYYNGADINGDVKAVEMLCHNFIEIKKLKDVEKNKT